MITENVVKFKDFEQKIFKWCHKLGCEIIKKELEDQDARIMLSRDRTVYRHKGLRKTVIKTLMGEVEYRRAIYESKQEDGTTNFVYLLDKAMDIEKTGFISELLSEKIVKESCESTYRNAAREVSELTGQSISHTAAWGVIQNVGEKVDKQEKQKLKLAKKLNFCANFNFCFSCLTTFSPTFWITPHAAV